MHSQDSASRLNAVLASLEIGVVILDRDFRVEVWNQFMENHSQIASNDIVGTLLFVHFRELQSTWLKRKCEPVFALAAPVFIIWEQHPYLFKFEASRPVTSDSDFMYQNVTITPMLDEHGKVSKLCLMIYDVTDQALAKMRIENLNQRLKTISRVDGLTGLYNRRYWQERFDREFKLSKRNQSTHSLLMLDIDHFKSVNDNYGHQTGDEVIRHLATVIAKATRETDVAGRYGGEEFVILLPDTKLASAYTVAERIRTYVEQSVIEYESNELKYTCSVGLAEISADYLRPNLWIEAADQALYLAKTSGRNCIKSALDLPA
ncbi:diguanylate cyclase [Glaciecola sp. 2405UD65-10]|uniref:sensor domain-containing diguanylate cyclase n=1 Tax=Glaciecola sp. 2405UD65-10 TaxID=3397244 RepID=UPI003B599932